ncbi:DUF2850 domain-containing protein [Vibrio ostreicida]|uniref:DUF2850 domain-containing protein n=1 Tax=Vibrio ostreicida TaxID=526588 RepID=A0ABT8BT52_9VIBR|nr:DUF2850 domain-containing protein [Vibrio ostreicida]MDN3609554.1 DUF2850 domain-containing protein [Vibrio ostreicida]NPD08430.1 DUF2850 domain-containing protein [Vibrio ostreicida]
MAGPTKKNGMNGVLIFVGVLAFALIGVGINSILTYQKESAQQELYGLWQESDVASYSANTLHVTDEGIYWNEDLVSTRYDFDGEILKFSLGNKQQQFYLDLLKGRLVHLNGNYKAKYLKHSSLAYAHSRRTLGR